MPDFPEKPTDTIGSGSAYVFGGGIPVVRSINGYQLGKLEWEHQVGNTYTKNGNTIRYDGVYWYFNDRVIEYIENIPKELR